MKRQKMCGARLGCLVMGLALCGLVNAAIAQTFTPTGNLTQERSGHTATLLADGKVLLLGGINNSKFLSSAELYDPATGGFTATGSLNLARTGHTATLLSNGKVLITGGITGGYSSPSYYEPLSSAELYDPATGQFTSITGLNTGRAYHTATPLAGGKVLITGGTKSNYNYEYGYYDHPIETSSAELYDPATGSFTPTGDLNAGRAYHTATLLNNGKVLVNGGGIGDGYGYFSEISSAELYDPATGLFSATGTLSQGRMSHTATLLANDSVLVAGGAESYGYVTIANAELYNPATGLFTSTGSLNQTRNSHTATLLNDGTVLVAGGWESVNWSSVSSAELYVAATGSFTPTGNLNTARSGHTATLLGNGSVLVAGGSGSSGSLMSAELYTPAPNTAPTATAQAIETDEDTATPITLSASDAEGDALTYTIVSGPTHGTLSGTGANRTYTPDANYAGSDSFTFKANDGTDDSDIATVSITVNAVNNAPVAVNDTAATTAVTSVAGNVLTNDSDADEDALTAALVTSPANGELEFFADGTYTYTPAVGFTGTDGFTYQANDGMANSNVATVTISVTQPATSLGSKVTGGGLIASNEGGRASFNLNAQSNKDGSVLKGKVDHADSNAGVFIRSSSITGIVVDGTVARIFGKATLNGAGSYDFVIEVVDNGEPGDNDIYRIRLSNGFSSGVKTLQGGNIQVHK